MVWNYRICQHHFGYGLHEAYYDEDGFVNAVTTDPVPIYGDTLPELKEVFDLTDPEWMRRKYKDV